MCYQYTDNHQIHSLFKEKNAQLVSLISDGLNDDQYTKNHSRQKNLSSLLQHLACRLPFQERLLWSQI